MDKLDQAADAVRTTHAALDLGRSREMTDV
jgi:hypothetical protein